MSGKTSKFHFCMSKTIGNETQTLDGIGEYDMDSVITLGGYTELKEFILEFFESELQGEFKLIEPERWTIQSLTILE